MKAHLISVICVLVAAPTIAQPDDLDPSAETIYITNAGENQTLPHSEHSGLQ